MDRLNPLLSEFRAWPAVQRNLAKWTTSLILAICACLAAAITLTLGRACGANCIIASFTDSAADAQVLLRYGYLAELNHGLFNLICFPIIIVTGMFLIQSFDDAIRSFINSGNIKVIAIEGISGGFIENRQLHFLARSNRRIFRIVTPLCILTAVSWVIIPESLSFNTKMFGWVQSWQIPSNDDADRLLSDWKFTSIPTVEENLKSNSANINVQIISGGAKNHRVLFGIFLACALTLQIALIAFGLWVIAKAVFCFVVLFQAFANAKAIVFGAPAAVPPMQGNSPSSATRRAPWPIRLREFVSPRLAVFLNFKDEAKRFGLTHLDYVYNAALWLALAAAFARWLQYSSNITKGTFYGNLHTLPFIGQWATLGLALVFFCMILAIPAFLLNRLAANARQSEVERIATAQRDLTNSPTQYNRLQKDKELARAQSAWPTKNWLSGSLILWILAFLLILPLPGFGERWVSPTVKKLPEMLCPCEQPATPQSISPSTTTAAIPIAQWNLQLDPDHSDRISVDVRWPYVDQRKIRFEIL